MLFVKIGYTVENTDNYYTCIVFVENRLVMQRIELEENFLGQSRVHELIQ